MTQRHSLPSLRAPQCVVLLSLLWLGRRNEVEAFAVSRASFPKSAFVVPRKTPWRTRVGGAAAAESSGEKVRLEDRNVPSSHQSLHDDLYGDGESHGSSTAISSADAPTETLAPTTPPPVLNGKAILPLRVVLPGLEAHKVAAVYAVLNNQYKRGSGDGWEHCEYVGVTRNLHASLKSHLTDHGADRVASVKALSFAYPQRSAMDDVAAEWRQRATDAGGNAASSTWASTMAEAATASMSEAEREAYEAKKRKLRKAMADPSLRLEQEERKAADNDRKGGGNHTGDEDEEERRKKLQQAMEGTGLYFGDDDDDYDDDDDDDDDWSMEIAAQSLETMRAAQAAEDANAPLLSPFSRQSQDLTLGGDAALEFSAENVDRVLEEVRPYLVADGGNVSVQRVDPETQSVYLVLEGACGSCPSSTVTMQMGIERVLKENFPDLGQVVRAEDVSLEEKANATKLTWQAVQVEINRIKPAVTAMGGVVEIVSVDADTGIVELRYRGANKVQQGVELAVRDVKFVNDVQFVA